jgi:hypothetical protein
MTASDYEFQLKFVVSSAWRLLTLMDDDDTSPSHGCFHPAYWRDKTSEFADARFQEASATLALLSLPIFDDLRRDGGLPPSGHLYDAFVAGLGFWTRSQHPEGCFDEWYKGERGFAATEFTCIAFSLAAIFLGDRLEPAHRQELSATLTRACDWLAQRHDRVKANHEAAGAAALGLGWKVTGNEAYRQAARGMIADTLSRQRSEGWFPEVGGMDLGYCSVLMDYVMLYHWATGEDGALPAMRRLSAFMLPHIHPDGTISPEAGLCLNPYVSRLGSGLLSPHDNVAAALVAAFAATGPGVEGLRPYLGDDLRLARWSHLPVVTYLLRPQFRVGRPLAESYPAGWTQSKDAALVAWHGESLHLFLSPAGGGMVRVYRQSQRILEDLGLSLANGADRWVLKGYDPERPVTINGLDCRIEASLGRPAFFYPSFLSRLVLRLGCTTPLGAKVLRWLVDQYRLRNRTAVNQSSAPLARTEAAYRLERTLSVGASEVVIRDRVVGCDRTVSFRSIFLRLIGPEPEIAGDAEAKGSAIAIEKRLAWTQESPSLRVLVSSEAVP